MYLLIKKTSRINSINLLKAGYKKINDWKYIFQINKLVRWHAKIIGVYVELHQDRTNKRGYHQVALSNIDKEINRIKNICTQ